MMLIFKKITDVCPEQWEIYKGSKKVGYIRLRSGRLTCRYPDYWGEVIYSHVFDDGMKGCFDSDEERNAFFDKCRAAIQKRVSK
ncbi:MAG: hypothetical protein J6P28_03160 [Treponema sp.]|nr:hypothetical protein [Treponema sp.]